MRIRSRRALAAFESERPTDRTVVTSGQFWTIGPTTLRARTVTMWIVETGRPDMSDHAILLPDRPNEGAQTSPLKRALAYGVLAVVVLVFAAAIQVLAVVVDSDFSGSPPLSVGE